MLPIKIKILQEKSVMMLKGHDVLWFVLHIYLACNLKKGQMDVHRQIRNR